MRFIMSSDIYVRVREGLRLRGGALSYSQLQKTGIRLVRIGDNLYTHGSEQELEGLIEDPIDDWLDAEDVAYENPNNPNYEEIELTDLEVNTGFSETAALAEGGGFVATSSIPGISTPSIVTGVVLGAGTVAIGTTIGVLSGKSEETDHTPPVVSLPEHNYIGPGNSVDSGIAPVDRDDEISQQHDINYNQAKTQQDIQHADDTAIGEFVTDFVDSGNIHSAIGAIGLGTKRVIESAVGVKYPPNLPSVSGMGKYNPYQDPRKNDAFPKRDELSPAQFKNRATYAWDQWNRLRQRANLPRVDPPARLGIGTTFRPPIDRNTRIRPDNASISFDRFRDNADHRGPLIEGFDRQREQQESRNDHMLNTVEAMAIDSDEEREINDIIAQSNAGTLTGEGVNGRDMSDRTNKRARADGDVGGPSSGSGGPVAGPTPVAAAAAGGKGHNSPSDGGFDSAQGPMTVLARGGYKTNGGQMSFSKVHRMKSWAIPYWSLNSADRGGSKIVTTPLAKIPWEYAFMYLSPEEFDL